jgi:hypothetical protein
VVRLRKKARARAMRDSLANMFALLMCVLFLVCMDDGSNDKVV